MKKKRFLLLFIFIFSLFLFNINVKATSSLKCKGTTSGKDIICNVETDEIVYITSSLDISSVSGENNSYKAKTATFENNGSINFKTVSKGEYKIKIENQDKTYINTEIVTVNEEKATTTTQTTTTKKKSSNNLLKSITIDNEDIENFSSDKTKYYVTVKNEIKKVILKAIAQDDTSTVSIDGPSSLDEGDNEYTIGVIAEDESTKYYKVIITREEKEKESNTDIKSIKIKGYNFKFDKYSKTFYLNIKKEDTELDITVKTKDELATYEIDGNDNLKDGSEIKITVKAEDGSTDTYRIIIQKKDNNLMPIIIISSIVFVIIVVIIIILSGKKKKKKEDKKSKEDIKKDNSTKEEEKDYRDEKTIEMPHISDNSSSSITNNISSSNNKEYKDDEDFDDTFIIDNDEEDKTKMFSYDKNIDEDISNIINEELEKTLSFDDLK